MRIVRIADIKGGVKMLKVNYEKGICKGCGEIRYIVSKNKGLCSSCMKKRSFNLPKKTHVKSKARKATGERELFLKIWEERSHYCQHCGMYLGEEPKSFYFSHIKGKGAYPELRLDPNNIELLCYECHHKWDFGDEKKKK